MTLVARRWARHAEKCPVARSAGDEPAMSRSTNLRGISHDTTVHANASVGPGMGVLEHASRFAADHGRTACPVPRRWATGGRMPVPPRS